MPATRARYYETKENVISDPYDAFSVAVIKRAVLDYKTAAKRYNKAETENKALYRKKMNDIERFFKSDLGQILCFGYGERIVNELKKLKE